MHMDIIIICSSNPVPIYILLPRPGSNIDTMSSHCLPPLGDYIYGVVCVVQAGPIHLAKTAFYGENLE
jgi:hypothetical protein